MKAALKNDWYSLRFMLLIMSILCVLLVEVYTITPSDGFFEIASPILYTAFIPIALYMIDERSKWGSFAAGLPGKRSAYIHAKYIAGIVSILLAMAVSIICCLVRVFVTGQNETDGQIPVFMLGFAAALMMCSVFLPSVTRFGARIGIILYLILITLCGIIAGYMEAMMEDGELAAPDYYFSLPVVGAAVIIYLLSWLITLQIYKNMEL